MKTLHALLGAGCLVVSAAHAAEPKIAVLVPQAASDLKPLPEPEKPATEKTATEKTDAPAANDGLVTKWWLWAVIGVVATGSVATLAVVVGAPQPRGTTLGDGNLRKDNP